MHTIAAPLISASTKLKFRDLHQIIISHVNFRDGSFLTEAHRRTEGCRLPRPNDWYHLLSLGIEFRSMQNAKTAIHYDCGSPLTGAGQPSGGIVGHTTRHTTRHDKTHDTTRHDTTRHDTTRHDTLFKLFDCIRKLMRVFWGVFVSENQATEEYLDTGKEHNKRIRGSLESVYLSHYLSRHCHRNQRQSAYQLLRIRSDLESDLRTYMDMNHVDSGALTKQSAEQVGPLATSRFTKVV